MFRRVTVRRRADGRREAGADPAGGEADRALLGAPDERGNVAMGHAVFVDTQNVRARVRDGARLAVVGMDTVAVTVDAQGVLVCHLDHERFAAQTSQGLKVEQAAPFQNLQAGLNWFDDWMRTSALPLWWTLGADHDGGGFHDRLVLDGSPAPGARRVRVQARQAYAYAAAGEHGWPGPWRVAALHAFADMTTTFSRPDGLYSYWGGPGADAVANEAQTYDQAFVLLASAACRRAGVVGADFGGTAGRLRGALENRRLPQGGYREIGRRPFQANANMHLFEAALAWAEIDPTGWGEMADEIGNLALGRLFDRRTGVIHEVFDSHWAPAEGDDGRLIEPGHQFEWAWLLDRWGRLRGADDACRVARTLFATGARGVDERRGVAMNALRDDFTVLDGDARLWPQTERLRTSCLYGDAAAMLDALVAIRGYLDTPTMGLWRDVQASGGGFQVEPAPASSLYHLVGAWREVVPGAVNR